ncbi:MAG: hypothetical protein N2111_12050 [Candidatus Sumerlaeaceae bacterium]|nr:hypothetical protein [Candidatus Sumerlaeaceae bacterium]
MAVRLDQIKGMLDELEMKYTYIPKDNTQLGLRFVTQNYLDKNKDHSILVIIQLSENGEYLTVYCPNAYKITGRNQGVFLKLCMMIQWMTKLIQFEFDHHDGEIRPVVEFPIEDGTITARQLARCVGGLVGIIDTCDTALRTAAEQGILDLSLIPAPSGAPSPDELRRMLEEMFGQGGQRPPDEL